MLRLATSAFAPNALRAIASSRILHGSITNALSVSTQEYSRLNRESHNYYSLHFSTDAKKQLLDRHLVKMLKSEIESKQYLEKSLPPPPADFPFKIHDDPCKLEITLTRELDGQKIDVVVPSITPNQDDEEESDASNRDTSDDGDEESNISDRDTTDDDEEESGAAENSSSTDCNSDEEEEKSLKLNVKISKENGKRLDIEVSASDDNITINELSVNETASESGARLLCFGPYLVGEDNDLLQSALREFLEYRGIKKSYVGFLYKYMVRRYKRDPMLWLKELEKFIKE